MHSTKSDDGSPVVVLSATDTLANIEDNPMVNRSVVGGDRRFLSQVVGLRFLWVLSLAFVSTLPFAQSPSPKSPTLKKDVPFNYVVQQGDTLWGISGVYLQEAWRWPELWDANPQLDNPHRIYPGDVLASALGRRASTIGAGESWRGQTPPQCSKPGA